MKTEIEIELDKLLENRKKLYKQGGNDEKLNEEIRAKQSEIRKLKINPKY